MDQTDHPGAYKKVGPDMSYYMDQSVNGLISKRMTDWHQEM